MTASISIRRPSFLPASIHCQETTLDQFGRELTGAGGECDQLRGSCKDFTGKQLTAADFVGRQHDLAALTTALRYALAGRTPAKPAPDQVLTSRAESLGAMGALAPWGCVSPRPRPYSSQPSRPGLFCGSPPRGKALVYPHDLWPLIPQVRYNARNNFSVSVSLRNSLE